MRKNKNKGFSLMEIIVAVAILSIFCAVLIPSYIHLTQESRLKQDHAKFEGMCTSFKMALTEPEVRKEFEELSSTATIKVVCQFDENGYVVFGDGKLLGVTEGELENSPLWLNSYQSIGLSYQTASKDFNNKYIVFTMTPKTTNSTATCEYEILETYP